MAYVARCLLDLLHPYSRLTQLVIENVSPADRLAQADPKAFLGVDVSEYYGGEDAATSEAVHLVQVKYSPLRPTEGWTRSRLTAKKDGGESVLRKLAAMFDAQASSASSPTPGARVTIRLLTNQPLGPQLRQDLEILRGLIESKSSLAAGAELSSAGGRAGQTAKVLQSASGLSWTRFSEFLAAWDLAGFGHPSLAHTEAALFEALSGFSRNGSEQLEVLLGSLQIRATPGQRETIRRKDVLSFLRLREDDLYPAPTNFQDDVSLFETRSSALVSQAIEQGDNLLVVHGRSGAGKTSALRLALRDHGGGGKAVLYDCYAGGKGLRPGAERFPYRKCFTQIINELDARYRTGILATVNLDYPGLMRQLDRALEAAAIAAEQENHHLVLAFDAIDNASEQKRRAPSDAGDSFVPLLWRLILPRNCTLAVSLRTENLSEIVGDSVPHALHLEVTGFNEEETQRHVAQFTQSLPSQEVSFLHERTAGNPRVQSKVLRDIASHPQEDAHRIIQETARKTAFEYYDQEDQRHLALDESRRVLAVLYEMRQAPQLTDVSAITQLAEQEVRGIIGDLSFGVRLNPGDRVTWQDQDFLDWTGERLKPERKIALVALAEYCLRRFNQDEYARWNLSYHLLQAEQLEQLVAWWKEPGRLDEQIRAAHPHEERVLDDLRATLLGTLQMGQMREAFDLLLRASDIAEGRDAFADALAEYPSVAVAADLASLLPGGPGNQPKPIGSRVREAYSEASLTIATELACRPERRDLAEEVFVRFKAAKMVARVRDPEHGGNLNQSEWELYARYQTRIRGISGALRFLDGRKSTPWSRLFAFNVGSDWQRAQAHDPFGELANTVLGPAEHVSTILGILAAIDFDSPQGAALRNLNTEALEHAVGLLVRALTPGSSDPTAVLQNSLEDDFTDRPGWAILALGTAVENLTAAGFSEVARALLSVWHPPRPRYRLRSHIEAYLRWAALRETLTGTPFESASYEIPTQPNPSQTSQGDSDERELREVRFEMGRIYRTLLTRTLAWAGTSPENIPEKIHHLAASWKDEAQHFTSHSEWSYQVRAAFLLEAILALPGRHILLVREIIEAAENALGESQGLARSAGANVLSHDDRYLGEAERLIRGELERCRPPQIPARDGMERLFYLYSPAARISGSLARRVIVAAREVASEIDSRIYARAEALITIAEAAQPNLAPERLDKLCALIRYWWSINVEAARKPGERALVLLAQKAPGNAVMRAWELDQRGLLDFEDGLGHVAVGALMGRSIRPQNIWPILPLLTHPVLLDTVARSSIEQLHERALPVDAALRAYCRQARLDSAASHPVERAQEIAAWGRLARLGSHPEIQVMQAYAEKLGSALDEQEPVRRLPEAESSRDLSRHREETSPLFEVVSEQLQSAPRSALERLEKATGAELNTLGALQLGLLQTSFLETLPLSDRPRLAAIIERWGADSNGAEALPLLDALLGDGGTSEPILIQVAVEAVRRLLTPDTLRSVAFAYHSETRAILFQGRWAPPAVKLEVILSAIAEHLRELGSDTLFYLAGQVAKLLNPTDLADIASDFISRTVEEAPELGNPAFPRKEPQEVVPHALTLALGHPRQALRWRGVYSVVHALADTEEPDSFLSPLNPLLDALDSTDLPRWLSVREWLSFALEHVALRKPSILRSAIPRLLPHAISRELPHAKIRHHLKQALLTIEDNFPGTVNPKNLEVLKQVNQPIMVVSRGEPSRPALGTEWQEELEDTENENRLTPGFMDTVRYWYQPLINCFAVDGAEAQRAILQKSSDWMARLGVTRNAVETEHQQVGTRYTWQDTNNDHGSQPRVELLRLYGERHGLYLVAGELIDSLPVLETHWSDGAGNMWGDWARYDLRGGDPALPARLLDAPPPLADNYDAFSGQIDIWRKKEEAGAFYGELELHGEPEWIIISGNREGFGNDRSFTVTIDSALVSPQSAKALARLLESGSRDAFLPFSELYYACTLPKIEGELQNAERRLSPIRGEHNAGDGRFVLKSWVVRFYQEAALHAFDPFWPRNGRNYVLPTFDISRRLGWVRHPTELVWHDAAGQLVARCDLWRSDGGSRSTEGCRLVMRRDMVSAYAREVGLEVIFAVQLRRQGRVIRYGTSGDDEYDSGTTRCFLWSELSQSGTGRVSNSHGKIPQD